MDLYNKWLRKTVKDSKVLQKLSERKFLSPKGCANYRDVAVAIAVLLESAELGVELGKQYEWSWLNAIMLCHLAYLEPKHHVFKVEESLFDSLESANPPPLSSNPKPFGTAVFLLPTGRLKHQVSGNNVDWLLVSILDCESNIPPLKFSSKKQIAFQSDDIEGIRYSWMSLSVGMDIFTASIGYSNAGVKLEKQKTHAESSDADFSDRVSNLVENLIYWIGQLREYTYEKTQAPPRKGQGFGKNESGDFYLPISLSFSNQPHRVLRVESNRNRKSPRPHLRRADWRRVCVGSRKENKREWRLIPLCHVLEE